MKTLIGKKIGMMQYYTDSGLSVPATVLDVSNNYITKKVLKDDKVVLVEVGKDKKKNFNKSEEGMYKSLGFVPVITEASTKEITDLELASVITPEIFKVGDKVSVSGISKGKGFAGGVKRYGFHGGSRTHGQSDRERAPGSIGSGTTLGRVFKGTRMAGHMGVDNMTIKNLKVLMVDSEKNLIVVKGSVPGTSNRSYLVIKGK